MRAGQRWIAALVATLAAVAVAPEGVQARGRIGSEPAVGRRPITVVELTSPAGVTRPEPLHINDRGQVLAKEESPALPYTSQGAFWDRGDTEGTLLAVSPPSAGHNVRPFDLNDRGVVVGHFTSAVAPCPGQAAQSAFSWRAGEMTTLALDAACAASPRFVNDRGQVLGFRTFQLGTQVVAWEDGEVVDSLPVPYALTSVEGLNNRGQALVWTSALFTDVQTAAVWQIGGELTELGTLGGSEGSRAVDINDRGQVVGYSTTADGAWHAFLWEDGEMTDLGTLGGEASYAEGINERGQVFGSSETATGATHAFFWDDGEMTDLGALPGTDFSNARAMNDRGQVVGSSSSHAFLWEDGEMTDLGTSFPPDVSTAAFDINDRGQVVGRKNLADGTSQVVIWNTPRR